MKINFKQILLISFLGVPLVITPIVSASSGVISTGNEQVKQEVPVNEPSSVTKPSIADGSTGTVSLSIYRDYPIGSSYPSTLYNYAHWYTPSQKYVYGNLYISDAYLSGGKLRVWYSGKLY